MSRWTTVTKAKPCPICDRADWCGRTVSDEHGVEIVRCMRADGSSIPGWRALKTDAEGGTTFIDEAAAAIAKPQARRRPPEPVHVPKYIEVHQAASKMIWEAEHAQKAADWIRELGLETGAIPAFDIGYTGKVLTVPMRDENGEHIGTHIRFPDGSKKSITGSRNGLYIPDSLLYEGRPKRPLTQGYPEPVVIVEGWTDAAAMMQIGFCVIGRPSNVGSVAMLTEVVRGHHVVILGESDGRYQANTNSERDKWKQPGTDGPRALAEALIQVNKSVRISTPGSSKDAREWVRSGATREVMLKVFRTAEAIHA